MMLLTQRIRLASVALLSKSSLIYAFVSKPHIPDTISIQRQGETNNIMCSGKRRALVEKSTMSRWKRAMASSTTEEKLTPKTIAEMIEVSFIQSCLQLSQGYVDVLKLFIVAVKAGYEATLSFEELSNLVENCPVQSAGRVLQREEKDLRQEWILVVYEMLNRTNWNDKVARDGVVSSIVTKRVLEVVSCLLALQEELKREEDESGGKIDATAALNSITIEQTLGRSRGLSELNNQCRDPIERVLLRNDVRVALLTCKVLEEEKLCSDVDRGEDIPRPPVPGTGI